MLATFCKILKDPKTLFGLDLNICDVRNPVHRSEAREALSRLVFSRDLQISVQEAKGGLHVLQGQRTSHFAHLLETEKLAHGKRMIRLAFLRIEGR